MESRARSIAKALSYRLLGSTVTFGVALFVTRKLPMATLIGVVDVLAKVAAYYIHERVWERIAFGQAPTLPDGVPQEETVR